MDISDIVTTEYETVDVDTRAAEVVGVFRESGAKAIVVTDDGEYAGVVTQARLGTSNRDPDQKAGTFARSVAQVAPTTDVRTVARLLVGSSAQLLPVFEGDAFVGVVTAADVLSAVRPYLNVLTVEDVCTHDLETVGPQTTLGEVLHAFREHHITHLPVYNDESLQGIVSVQDLLGFATREVDRSQGGSPSGALQGGDGSPHGGFGERGGDLDRLLDLPATDVMSSPAETAAPDDPLDDATGRMLEADISSLVVVDGGDVTGILTRTDVLAALSIPEETAIPVQITNIDLLDDCTREAVVELVEDTVRKDGNLTVLEANVYLHEHDEKLRGTPLLMARIRLFTDRGHFVGTGEGYGASHALGIARDTLERQILDDKEYARTKKHMPVEELAERYGWWMTGTGAGTEAGTGTETEAGTGTEAGPTGDETT